MTKRDFFRVVVKLFGLYSAVTAVFYILPSNMHFFISDELSLNLIISILAPSLVMISIFIFLIFKADAVVNLLKLDKGFDDDIISFGELNVKHLVEASCIFIGGLLILDNITQFVSHALNAFADKVGSKPPSVSGDSFFIGFYNDWFSAGLNVLIGYLLIKNYGWISEKLVGSRTNTTEG